MTRTLPLDELAAESGTYRERIECLTSIGVLEPRQPGRFGLGAAFGVKLVGALLEAGFAPEQIEWAASVWGPFVNLD